jgi:hypothetical protein
VFVTFENFQSKFTELTEAFYTSNVTTCSRTGLDKLIVAKTFPYGSQERLLAWLMCCVAFLSHFLKLVFYDTSFSSASTASFRIVNNHSNSWRCFAYAIERASLNNPRIKQKVLSNEHTMTASCASFWYSQCKAVFQATCETQDLRTLRCCLNGISLQLGTKESGTENTNKGLRVTPASKYSYLRCYTDKFDIKFDCCFVGTALSSKRSECTKYNQIQRRKLVSFIKYTLFKRIVTDNSQKMCWC